jgi:hypothetical protein
VLAAQLRLDFDAIPYGPARVFAVPQKVWAEVAPDDEWPQHLLDPERRPDGSRMRKRGRRQPIALEPGRGNWPRVISGDIARRLLQRGAVARVIATTEWLDGWWLRSLLGPTAPIHVRHTECSDPTLAAELEQRARAEYGRAIRMGWASWT